MVSNFLEHHIPHQLYEHLETHIHLHLIYYLTKTDNDVKINKDWNELKNMPLFWLTIVTGLIFLVGLVLVVIGCNIDSRIPNAKNMMYKLIGYGATITIFGLLAFTISGTILLGML